MPADLKSAELAQTIAAHVAAALRNNPPILAEYLDENGVAAMTGFGVRALEGLRYRKEGPKFFRVGRSIRYRASDVRAWIEGEGVSK